MPVLSENQISVDDRETIMKPVGRRQVALAEVYFEKVMQAQRSYSPWDHH
jgi:hypothetical protein